MFKVITRRQVNKELINTSKLPFSDLLADCLRSIGFVDIKKTGNRISFRSSPKDGELESFQRRYGNGTLSYDLNDDGTFVNIITDNTFDLFLTICVNGFVFVFANYLLVARSKGNLLFILILDTLLIIGTIVSIWSTKRHCRNKHQKLLDLLMIKMEQFKP